MFARTDAIPRLNASNNFDYSDLRTAIEHDALNVMTPWTFRGGIKYFYVATYLFQEVWLLYQTCAFQSSCWKYDSPRIIDHRGGQSLQAN